MSKETLTADKEKLKVPTVNEVKNELSRIVGCGTRINRCGIFPNQFCMANKISKSLTRTAVRGVAEVRNPSPPASRELQVIKAAKGTATMLTASDAQLT